MKIGVVGCGALGSYYGAKLCRAGREVHFLLRSDYDAVRRRGVRVQSVEGDFRAHPRCARAPEQIGVCNLVLIALKTTANEQFPRLLPPLVGPNTAVVTLQNGLGNEAPLAALFGAEKILGGLCFVCLNRIGPGLVHHLAHGSVVLGEYQRWPEPPMHISYFASHEAADQYVLRFPDRARTKENDVRLRMRPPTAANRLTSNCLSQDRDRAAR